MAKALLIPLDHKGRPAHAGGLGEPDGDEPDMMGDGADDGDGDEHPLDQEEIDAGQDVLDAAKKGDAESYVRALKNLLSMIEV